MTCPRAQLVGSKARRETSTRLAPKPEALPENLVAAPCRSAALATSAARWNHLRSSKRHWRFSPTSRASDLTGLGCSVGGGASKRPQRF